MPKTNKHGTLTKLKEAIAGKEEPKKTIIVTPVTQPSPTTTSSSFTVTTPKLNSTNNTLTTHKDISNAVLKKTKCSSTTCTGKKKRGRPASPVNPEKLKEVNAWKSPRYKKYSMVTLHDEDRKRLAYIQKVLKTKNSAKVFRIGLKEFYNRLKEAEQIK